MITTITVMVIIEAATATLITMTIIVTKITISITLLPRRRQEEGEGSHSRWVAKVKLYIIYLNSFGSILRAVHLIVAQCSVPTHMLYINTQRSYLTFHLMPQVCGFCMSYGLTFTCTHLTSL